MTSIQVQTGKPYRVTIGRGLLAQCGEMTAVVKAACRVMLVSDDIVFALYGQTVTQSYEAAGFAVHHFVFANGERSKNMDTLVQLLEEMAAAGLTRGDLAVALGGGVTGDLTGFAAAAYLRGIPYVQLPTTFLAAIDSSVGGKTGVNLAAGKNLAGAFHQPIAVFCDIDSFNTLPREIFLDGMCEAVKYGCIAGASLFDELRGDAPDLAGIVAACVEMKRDLVERDEFDRGDRQMLNFGHTPAHAIEKLSGYAVSHGHAVGMGMCIMGGAFAPQIRALLEAQGVDTRCPYTAAELAQVALSDKKRSGGMISLVLLERIGKAYLKEIAVGELAAYFEKGLHF